MQRSEYLVRRQKANERPNEVDLSHPIYLTGFMGSGKSTVGPRLADRLNVPFMDLDALIVERAGRSIPMIFAEGGEAAFRRLEREALCDAASGPAAVVALGGGAIANPENLMLLRQTGTVIYLATRVDTLAERLAPAAAHRPLLQSETGTPLSGEALRARVAALLDERAHFYAQADIAVCTDDQTVGDVVDEVMGVLKVHLENAK